METKWTKWYAMTSHVIAYRSLELLFGTHTFHFNCLFEDFNCVFTRICCLSRVLSNGLGGDTFTRNMTDGRQTDFDTKLIYPFFLKKKAGITNTNSGLHRKSKGQRPVPCGVSNNTSCCLDFTPSRTTCCF